MREIRLSGSEGGGAHALPTPIKAGPAARTPALVRLKGCLIRKVQVLPRPGSRPVTNDNCVAVRRGGEQSEVNDSSVRKKLDSAGVGGEPASDVRSPDPGTPVLGEVQRAD